MLDQIKIVLKPIAVTLLMLSVFMVMTAIIALYLDEVRSYQGIYKTIIFTISLAVLMLVVSRRTSRSNLSLRAGFLLVTMIWVMVSFVGALPYYLSGSIPNLVDAIFESTSGFTTTGASILTDIEALPRSILFWRAMTHWLGGGGIIVLSVAILPLLGIGGMQIMKAEAPGPKLDKLTPRIGQTAKYIWFLYMGLTAIFTIIMLAGGMNLLDAFAHASSALSTGGFSTKNASVFYYNSAFIEWALIVAMFLGGMNFILMFRFLTGRFYFFKVDSEFKAYVTVIVIASAVVSITNIISEVYDKSVMDTIRYSTFQVVTILTTTGYSSDNYLLWPTLSQAIIFLMMFMGGCTGSTSGGLKMMRHVVLLKQSLIELKYLVHRSSVQTLRLNGQPIKNDIIHSIIGLIGLYIMVILVSTVIISSADVDVITALTSALATLGTIGPGFGKVGPIYNYGFYPDYIKYLLSFLMLLGRLEIYTILVIFMPWFWKR